MTKLGHYAGILALTTLCTLAAAVENMDVGKKVVGKTPPKPTASHDQSGHSRIFGPC